MFAIIKLILGVSLLGAVFGFGYLWGSQKTDSFQINLDKVRSELTSKIELLEHSLRRTRIRIELMNVRSHLATAQTAVKKKNFGEAKEELERARKAILKTSETADEEQKKELTALATLLEGVQKQVSQPNPRMRLGVDEAIQALDKILS